MSFREPHRKRIHHFHEPGDVHELTFSCYRRLPLLTNNAWRTALSRSIDDACHALGCHLAAFVYMPEHVHLLVWGMTAKEQVSLFLARSNSRCPYKCGRTWRLPKAASCHG